MESLTRLKKDFKEVKHNHYISEKQAKFIERYFDAAFALGADYVYKKQRPKNDKKVHKLLNGKVVDTFDSMTSAAKDVKVDSSSIRKAIKNNHKSGGYYWSYAE